MDDLARHEVKAELMNLQLN